MSEPVLAIMRHADYHQPAGMPSAWLPYPLTPEGEEQAAVAAGTLAAFLQSEQVTLFEEIHCSNMLRAWQTASIIANSIGRCRVVQFDDLAERGVGAVANLTTTEIEALMTDDPRYEAPPAGWKSDSDYRLPFQGAESLGEAGRRVAAHLTNCMDHLQQQSTPSLQVIVAHGASLRHAAMHLGLLTRDTVGSVSMYHARPLFLTREDGAWQVHSGDWKPRGGTQQSDEYGVV